MSFSNQSQYQPQNSYPNKHYSNFNAMPSQLLPTQNATNENAQWKSYYNAMQNKQIPQGSYQR
jgi:hypothetical protein